MREITIAGRVINDDAPPFVIAEIGNNHQGRVDLAMQMIKAAADAGASAVKFQTRNNRQLYTAAMYDSPYHSENAFGPTYGTHRDALELPRGAYPELMDYAEECGVAMFSTPFDYDSAEFLASLDVPAFKIASGDLTNIPFLRFVAGFGKPMIVSTGGGTRDDVLRMADAVMGVNRQLAILQCTASYPADPAELNLRVIESYRRVFSQQVIGLSDHHSGILSGPLAYMLGARIFEKHFTLNRSMRGTDHAFSLEPGGLRKFVRDLQRTPLMLGDGAKVPFESEAAGIRKMSKSLCAARALPAGHVLRYQDVTVKSPGGGLPPWQFDDLMGRALARDVAAEEAFAQGMFA